MALHYMMLLMMVSMIIMNWMMIVMLNMYDYQDEHGIYVRNLSSNHLNDDNNVNADDDAFYGGTSS